MPDLSGNPLLGQSPAEAKSYPAGLLAILDRMRLSIENVLPAMVTQYDRTKNKATVKPMVSFVDANDRPVSRGVVNNVPVLAMGAGGYVINFPCKSGDLGWIVAADRDISAFLSSLIESAPALSRSHTFSDAMFIPDIFSKYSIAAEDDGAMVIQTVDSATRIAIDSSGEVRITAPSQVKITTPKTVISDDVVIGGNLEVAKNSTVAGMTAMNGGVDASASNASSVTLPANSTIGGINVLGHGHEQNGDSGRTSGGMEA